MDSLFKHKKMFLNPKYGLIGIFATPYFWIFEMIGPIIELLGYLIIPISYAVGILNIGFFLLFFSASILYGVILSMGAVLLEQYTFNKYPSISQLFKLMAYGFLENFGYRQLTVIYRLEGIFTYTRNKHVWGFIARKKFERG